MAEANPSAPALTTLIFVPGAWHSPTCYDPVIEHLESSTNNGNRTTRGATYNVVKVPLPSISCPRTSPSMTSWQPDVDAVLHVLESEIISMSATDGCENDQNNIKDVRVISHSYGSLEALRLRGGRRHQYSR